MYQRDEVCQLKYTVKVEPSNHVMTIHVQNTDFIMKVNEDLVATLKRSHVPMLERRYGLFYDPSSIENLEEKKRVQSTKLPNRHKITEIINKKNSNEAANTSSASAWRALANSYDEKPKDMKIEIEVVEQPLHESHDRRTMRSSSFDLSGMLETFNAQESIRLNEDKRFGHYNLPNFSHLQFKPIEEDLEQREFKGKKNFIRVYNAQGSYKTLYQPEDTPARYLYKELAEKFNITSYTHHGIFIKKGGRETLLGDEATPIQMLSDAEDEELDGIEFIFKDAKKIRLDSSQGGGGTQKKKSNQAITAAIQKSYQSKELNLSFVEAESFPEEFFKLNGITNLTINQAKLSKLPKISQFPQLLELRLVNNEFKEVPIEILEAKNLIELDMGNNEILEVPIFITQLSNLREIYFYVNQITEIPLFLTSLQQLQVMNFTNNLISHLPGELFVKLIHLEQIKVAGNKLTEIPPEIGNLKKLMDLTIARNQIRELPRTLCQLANLRWMDVQHNLLKQIPDEIINNMKDLEELMMNNNEIIKLPQKLRNLQTLLANNNQITEFPDEIELFRLKYLNLSFNKLQKLSNFSFGRMKELMKLSVTDNEIEYLPDSVVTLNQLTQLDCKHNLIKQIPDNLHELKNLKVIDISSNKISVIPDNFWFLPNLWFVQMAQNPIEKLYSTSAGMNKIKKLVTKIQLTDVFLSISNLQLPDNAMLLGGMHSLRTLDLNYANMQNLSNVAFKNLKNLRVLGLSGNKLATLPKDIGKLIGLNELYLSNNALQTLPNSLRKLRQLRVIDVSCNDLKNLGIFEKLNANSLTWLDISNNPQIKQIPPFMSRFVNLHTFHFYNMSTNQDVLQNAPSASHNNIQLSPRFTVSLADLQGRRDTMEDCMIVRGNFDLEKKWEFYSVLDGHGGSRVAEFGGEEFALRLHQLLTKSNCQDVDKTLRQTFSRVQNSIKTAQIGITEGATCVAALFIENQLYVANLGDSRAVLCRNKTAIRLSYDHKPELPEEETRIRALGGFVADGRINSVLAVSRALGDLALERWISVDPFISSTALQPADSFLILACDGVWDVLSDQLAVDLILENNNPSTSATFLRDHAFALGSMDNISCCVIHLK